MAELNTLFSLPFFLGIILKSLCVLCLVCLILRVWHSASAASRHALWLIALIALFSLPILTLTMPSLPIVPIEKIHALSEPLSILEVLPTDGLLTDPTQSKSASSGSFFFNAWFALWMLGTGVTFAVLVSHWWCRRALVLQAQRFDETLLDKIVNQEIDRWPQRPLTVLKDYTIPVPMTWGYWKPVIALPMATESWPFKRIRAVLLHEIAHIHRGDQLTQLIAQIICALHWFNPVVWFVLKQLRIEQEKACDDWVLAAGEKPSEYGRHLLAVVQSLQATDASWSVVPMARTSTIGCRIRSLLNVDQNRAAVSHRQLTLLATLIMCSTGFIAVFAFQSYAPDRPTAEPGLHAIEDRSNSPLNTPVYLSAGPGDAIEIATFGWYGITLKEIETNRVLLTDLKDVLVRRREKQGHTKQIKVTFLPTISQEKKDIILSIAEEAGLSEQEIHFRTEPTRLKFEPIKWPTTEWYNPEDAC